MTNAELDDRLAELVAYYQVAGEGVLERAREFQRARGGTLAAALCDLHVVEADLVSPLLEELVGVRAVDPSLMTVYPDFIERMNDLIPPSVVGDLLVFPAQAELNAIHVCMLNPSDGWTARALESLSGCRIVPLVSLEGALVGAIAKHYGAHLTSPPAHKGEAARASAEAAYRANLARPFEEFLKPAVSLMNRNRDAVRRDPKALEAMIREPSVIRLVQQILCRAVEAGASDLHIEPTPEALRIRIRVDGAMRVQHVLPLTAVVPLVSRLKAMADLPIGPAPTPLDARIGYEIVWGRAIDLRFSLVPSVTGEKVVLRVLDRSKERARLVDLGMDEHTREQVEKASDLPNGLILVTGPTGSGKSSTLYAVLDRLNGEDSCILTAEDPVESRIGGVTQVQCDEASGISFAAALRSFLRQDPDILMVGEIRDAETADIALKAALTGHLVLSTLHTNDSPGAVLRLLNMDLEPFMVASALRLVLAQRLIRRLCKACRTPLAPGAPEAQVLRHAAGEAGQRLLGGATIYEPVGCPECNGSGFRGRTGIYEVLRVTPEIEDLIIARASAAELRRSARQSGMRTLREAGLMKVASGESALREVLEHTVADADPLPGADKGAGVPTHA
ncbi:MAG: GspE/PulE family protein [Acidobacteria bacterium]|nr:GspE/PulE family protein [Acidobacteriota bacterium]